MKPKLYLESTIPSYLVARPSRDVILAGQQKITQDWWHTRLNDFEIFISDTVTQEVAVGDSVMAAQRLALIKPFILLAANDEVIELAEALVHGGPLPEKAVRDAVHIAVAAVHRLHFLLTWNCKHIANAQMFGRMREICTAHGFECPVICTPRELMAK